MPETIPPPVEATYHPSLLRRMIGFGLIGACGVVGSYVALGITDPSASEVIGLSRVEVETNTSGSVEALHAPLTDTSTGIGLHITLDPTVNEDDTALIANKLPQVAERISEADAGEEVFDIFADEYSVELETLARDIAIKTGRTLAIGGLIGLGAGLLLARKANLWVPPETIGRKGLLVGTLVLSSLGLSAAEMGTTYLSVDQTAAVRNFELRVKNLVNDQLASSTRSAVYNLDAIGVEVQKQLRRALGYTNLPEPRDTSNETIFVIGADEHNHPLAARTYRTLARAANAEGILSLGDTVDNATVPEQDALSGIDPFGVHFEGYQEITSCQVFNAKGECTKPGEQFPFAILDGNHRLADPEATKRLLGMTDLHQATSFEGVTLAALSDACADFTLDCSNGNAKAENIKQAEAYLAQLEEAGELPDSIFLASYDAVEVFAGKIPYIFAAGKHAFDTKEVKGSTVIYVGSIGQGGFRGAREASALIVSLDNQSGAVRTCTAVRWQATDSAYQPTVQNCFAGS